MRFDELHEAIPYALGKNLHALRMDVYPSVQIRMPGRHQKDTKIPGADFVVMVTDKTLKWRGHQFTHDDIFEDVYRKTLVNQKRADKFMNTYAAVIFGASPDDFVWEPEDWTDSLHPQVFLHAVQALGVAEHRRYAQHESKGGGRYLPARFASGIVEGLWTPADIKPLQRLGRPGLDAIIQMKGSPRPLKDRLTDANDSARVVS